SPLSYVGVVLRAGRNSPPAVCGNGREPASAFRGRVSRPGAMPGPTVTVRMKENVLFGSAAAAERLVIALGDVSVAGKVITMTHTRYAFIKAGWHAEIVDRALDGFLELIPREQVDVFDVPGAFEMPLLARDLAASGRYLGRGWRQLPPRFRGAGGGGWADACRHGHRRAGAFGVADAASLPGH